MSGLINTLPDCSAYIPKEIIPEAHIVYVAQVMDNVREYLASTPEEREKKLYEWLKEKHEESQ